MISPATADVMASFHSTNETLGVFVTSVYILGYSFGPLVIAPLSELYGRAIVYNVCNFILLIFTVACALAKNLDSLIVFRLFASIATSCPLTLGAGTIADMISRDKRGLAMALWVLGPLVGPTIGPLGEYRLKGFSRDQTDDLKPVDILPKPRAGVGFSGSYLLL